MDDKTLVERLIEFEKFIRGHDTLDGLWFGDTHSDFRGAFWWRRFSPIKEATDIIETLQSRIEALEAALRFYARENSWKSCGVYMCGHSQPSSAEVDRGNKARKALESKP